jgi:hypothetical protein
VTPWVPLVLEITLTTHTQTSSASDHGYDHGLIPSRFELWGFLNPFFTPSLEALSYESPNSHHASPQIHWPHNGSGFATCETLGLSPTTSNLPICELLNPIAMCSPVINGQDLVVTSDFAIYLCQVSDLPNS